jgi:hypothetical protein
MCKQVLENWIVKKLIGTSFLSLIIEGLLRFMLWHDILDVYSLNIFQIIDFLRKLLMHLRHRT